MPAAAATTLRERRDRVFTETVAELARGHDLQIDEVSIGLSGEQEVVLSPKGKYSSEAADVFERAFAEEFGTSATKTKITVIPF
jgi:hypothetical protein